MRSAPGGKALRATYIKYAKRVDNMRRASRIGGEPSRFASLAKSSNVSFDSQNAGGAHANPSARQADDARCVDARLVHAHPHRRLRRRTVAAEPRRAGPIPMAPLCPRA